MPSLGLIFASGFQALDFGRFDVLWISTTSALDSRWRRREKLEEMRRSPFLALKWRRVSSNGERCRYIIVQYSICGCIDTLNSRVDRPSFGFRILDSGFEEMKIPDCCRTFIAPLEAGHVAGSGSCASARLESLPAHIP